MAPPGVGKYVAHGPSGRPSCSAISLAADAFDLEHHEDGPPCWLELVQHAGQARSGFLLDQRLFRVVDGAGASAM
jgi:hypothetical protein